MKEGRKDNKRRWRSGVGKGQGVGAMRERERAPELILLEAMDPQLLQGRRVGRVIFQLPIHKERTGRTEKKDRKEREGEGGRRIDVAWRDKNDANCYRF